MGRHSLCGVQGAPLLRQYWGLQTYPGELSEWTVFKLWEERGLLWAKWKQERAEEAKGEEEDALNKDPVKGMRRARRARWTQQGAPGAASLRKGHRRFKARCFF